MPGERRQVIRISATDCRRRTRRSRERGTRGGSDWLGDRDAASRELSLAALQVWHAFRDYRGAEGSTTTEKR